MKIHLLKNYLPSYILTPVKFVVRTSNAVPIFRRLRLYYLYIADRGLRYEMQSAFNALNSQKIDVAVLKFQKLYDHHPENIDVLYGYGISLRVDGRYDDAIKVLSVHDKSKVDQDGIFIESKVSQERILVLNARAFKLYHAGNLDEAEKEFDAVLREHPEYSDAIYGKALVLKARGLFNQAKGLLEECDPIRFRDELNTLEASVMTDLIKDREFHELKRRSDDLIRQHPNISIGLLGSAICDLIDGDIENGCSRLQRFLDTISDVETLQFVDLIRTSGIALLDIGLASHCRDLFRLLNEHDDISGTSAARYNHIYLMIASARLNDESGVKYHGKERLHSLEVDPSKLLEMVLEQKSSDLNGAPAKQLDFEQTADEILSQFKVLHSDPNKLFEMVDLCMSYEHRARYLIKHETVNPLVGSELDYITPKLKEESDCIRRQCAIVLHLASKMPSGTTAARKRLFQHYVHAKDAHGASKTRRLLEDSGEVAGTPADNALLRLQSGFDGELESNQRTFEVVEFNQWLKNAGCQQSTFAAAVSQNRVSMTVYTADGPHLVELNYTSPKMQYGFVPKATIFGGGVTVNGQSQAISDDFMHPESSNFPDYVLAATSSHTTIQDTFDDWEGPENCISMMDMPIFRMEYFHVIAQYLPRLALLEEVETLDKLPVLLPGNLKNSARSLLSAMGFEDNRLVFAPPDSNIRLTNALIPSPSFEMRLPQSDEVRAMRNLLLGNHGESGAQQHRIYISRRAFNNRILTNEAELEEIAERLGYLVVQPEKLSIEQQIALFSRARVIVSATGGGLGNMIFMPSGGSVVCMTILRYAINFWPVMADSLGHKLAFIEGSPFFPELPLPVQTYDFKVDLKLFEDCLMHYS